MSEPATILVIDDDEAIRFGAKLRLVANGYRFLSAADGHAGVAMAKSEQPKAILLDVRMPRLDGLEALKMLRMDPATESIPVVMLSASADDESRALDDGAQFYLHKPYSKESLLTAVQAVLKTSEGEIA